MDVREKTYPLTAAVLFPPPTLSHPTPMRKPRVTIPQLMRAIRDGGDAWRMKVRRTVNGRTSPRATWDRSEQSGDRDQLEVRDKRVLEGVH